MPSLSTFTWLPAIGVAPALALAALLAGATMPVAAQGTAEQQEACTPDAVKLCAATIPDIAKTTACMKAHVAQLSPRCRAAFADATGAPAKAAAPTKPRIKTAATAAKPDTPKAANPRPTRVERREPEDHRNVESASRRPTRPVLRATSVQATPPVRREAEAPAAAPPPSAVPGLQSYEARIDRACREGLIDPFTCHNTLQALSLLR